MVSRFPEYLRKQSILTGQTCLVENMISGMNLFTVCQSARCPNRNECFAAGTATFLLLGKKCTRNCAFCAVEKGNPDPLDPNEPEKIAKVIQKLRLKHVVLTSVTRDDLEDGGAAHFTLTIKEIRRILPESTIEVLIPDFKGDLKALDKVLEANPDILNHNTETVPRLYPIIRPGADYNRSLKILKSAKQSKPETTTKSGMMLGMGENQEEIVQTMIDLHDAGCEILTMGQYLAPSENHYKIRRFITPESFMELTRTGLDMGFRAIVAGPFVRSSYHAHETWEKIISQGKEVK